MSQQGTAVEVSGAKFDLEAVLQTIEAHPTLAAILIAVIYLFWISRPGGLLPSLLTYWVEVKKLRNETQETQQRIGREYRAESENRRSAVGREEGVGL